MNIGRYGLMSPIEIMILRVDSEEAKNALRFADVVSDMICFHARVKRNGIKMMQPVDDYLNVEDCR